jgi:hypothetical protein
MVPLDEAVGPPAPSGFPEPTAMVKQGSPALTKSLAEPPAPLEEDSGSVAPNLPALSAHLTVRVSTCLSACPPTSEDLGSVVPVLPA